MKKFVFSLEKMMRYKHTLYETERNALASMRAQRRVLEERKENCQHQILDMDAEFRAKAATEGVVITDVNQINYKRQNAEKLIKEIDKEIAVLDVKIEKQLEIVIQLDKDVKGLEKLREKQFEEYTAEAMKEEQERISELVSSKYIEEQNEQLAEEILKKKKERERI